MKCLKLLKKLKKEFNFLCIVDEAHALGVLGSKGKGLGRDVADVAVGTLGKAFGLFGAFILGPQTVRDYLIHFAHAINFIGAWITQRMQPIGDLDRPGLCMAG